MNSLELDSRTTEMIINRRRVTIAAVYTVLENRTNFVGVGIAVLNNDDVYDERKAFYIASGRALKKPIFEMKVNGKPSQRLIEGLLVEAAELVKTDFNTYVPLGKSAREREALQSREASMESSPQVDAITSH